MTYYIVSYDDFYLSDDIVTLGTVENLINDHRKNDGPLFYCNLVDEYVSHDLKELKNGDYELTLLFNDDGYPEFRTVTLRKAKVY